MSARHSADHSVAVWVGLAMLAGWMAVRPFGFDDPRFLYADDFFYYLIPAQHFLAHGQFSFSPGMLTNGFHPLWMAVIVGLLAMCGAVNGWFYLSLNLLSAALVWWAGRLAMQMARLLGASRPLAVAAGVMVVAIQLMIGLQGMEVTLAVPLMLRVLCYVLRRDGQPFAVREWAGLGWLASLALLARLDMALLLLPWGCVVLWQRRAEWQRWMFAAFGAWPLLGYLLVNQRMMGLWLPVSGVAKQLKQGGDFSLAPLWWLLSKHGPNLLLLAVLCGLLVLAALATLAQSPARGRGHIIALLAGIPLYYGVLCALSDWQLWPWYFYPFVLVPPLTLAVLSPLGRVGEHAVQALAGMAVLMGGVFTAAYTQPRDTGILLETYAMQPFVAAHFGTYAMGDRAGTAGALLGVPLLQLEGLMGDAALLQCIRDRAPLAEVLRDYRVDYYITTEPSPDGTCFRLREPVRAGPHSPAMTGRVCAPAAFHSAAWPPVWIWRAADIR